MNSPPSPSEASSSKASAPRVAGLRASFELLLAWRIVRSKKSRFLSVITVVAVVGIATGVMALSVVLSVTGGFQSAFREKILGLHPHLIVWPRSDSFDDYREVRARLMQDPAIIGATPVTYDESMIAHGDRRAGAVVKGFDLTTAGDVVDLPPLMVEGDTAPLDEVPRLEPAPDGTFTATNLIQEAAYTVVATDAGPFVILERPEVPYPNEASLIILHGAPSLGPLDLAFAGSDRARIAALAPGSVSRPVSVPASDLELTLETGATSPSGATASVPVEQVRVDENDAPVGASAGESRPPFESEGTYLVVITGAGPARAHFIPVSRVRPGPLEARIRLLDLRTATGTPFAVRVGDESLPAGVTRTVPGRMPGIVLASALAERLEAKVGDAVSLASAYRSLTGRDSGSGLEPTLGRFQVSGIFRTGYHDYDKRFALVAFGAAQRFLGSGDRAKWLEVRVDDVERVEQRKRDVEALLDPYSLTQWNTDVGRLARRVSALYGGEISQYDVEAPISALGVLRNVSQAVSLLRSSLPSAFSRDTTFQVISWREVNAPLFEALQLQKLVLSIFFLIIIVVAAFNVVGTQIVMVHQKTREIAILKALGASREMIRRIFLLQGFLIALIGVALGLVTGLTLCALLALVGYPLEPEVYLISELPIAVSATEIGVVVAATLLLTLAATIGTAARAGRLAPADGIRYVE
ncbi:MAG: ABC transporter permease [Myxococcales bacterium]|nr:ABC transporter permease [Myxococcales bacterium]